MTARANGVGGGVSSSALVRAGSRSGSPHATFVGRPTDRSSRRHFGRRGGDGRLVAPDCGTPLRPRRGPAGALVASVASALGLAWGCLDDGRVSLFQPAFDDMLIDGAEVLEDDATFGRLTLGTTLLAARPGYRIEGRDATCVRHVLSDMVRTEVFYA